MKEKKKTYLLSDFQGSIEEALEPYSIRFDWLGYLAEYYDDA